MEIEKATKNRVLALLKRRMPEIVRNVRGKQCASLTVRVPIVLTSAIDYLTWDVSAGQFTELRVNVGGNCAIPQYCSVDLRQVDWSVIHDIAAEC